MLFATPNNIRLNSKPYFMMKIPNKIILRKAINQSSDFVY